MKTIIIPDIHNRVFWIEDFLSTQEYDRVIFLGDYFDDFNDTLDDAMVAAEWLKQSLKKPNRIHLYGTHDLWYEFPYNPFIQASGNTEWKEKVINEIITPSYWNKLTLFHFEQDYLMTHAGVHIYLISEYALSHKIFENFIKDNILQLSTLEIINKIIKPATDQAFKKVSEGHIDPWLDAGISRGGLQPVGGITWLDWNQEFEPIPFLNQIVGHTEHKYPQEDSTANSKNFNLDTRNKYIGILENGEFSWIKNKYL